MIEKLVRLTPEQYTDILTNGSGTFHDNETGEEVTISRDEIGDKYLVDTGYLELIRLTNMIQADMHHRYSFVGDHYLVKSLEEYYAGIVDANPDLANVSAYGYVKLLKQGDYVDVNTIMYNTQGHIQIDNVPTYLNGVLLSNTYRYDDANHVEVASVWVFESHGSFGDIVAPDDSGITELVVKKKLSAVNALPYSYIKTATTITATDYVLPVNPVGAVSVYQNIRSLDKVALSSNVTKYVNKTGLFYIPKNFVGFAGNTSLTWIELQELIYLGCNPSPTDTSYTDVTNRMFYGCSNPDLTIIWPKVAYINGANNASNAIFYGCYDITIPSTVVKIRRILFINNHFITLKCINASIDDTWCGGTPSEGFALASDWSTSINIATAAHGRWIPSDFVQFLSGKDSENLDQNGNPVDNIHDFRVNGELPADHVAPYIKIAPSDLNLLIAYQDDETGENGLEAIQLAQAKGWTIDGI